MSNLDNHVKASIKAQVLLLLTGIVKKVNFERAYYAEVKEVLKELNFEDKDNFESNGWQWDFWADWKKYDNDYCVAGSGYYGNLTMYIKEKQEND